ncbi:MAG: hypothetical protein V1850_07775 [Candidatus Bathyarchaeota archaeon]
MIRVRLLSNSGLDQSALRQLEDRLAEAFPNSRISIADQAMHPPSSCLNRSRGQYNSTLARAVLIVVPHYVENVKSFLFS